MYYDLYLDGQPCGHRQVAGPDASQPTDPGLSWLAKFGLTPKCSFWACYANNIVKKSSGDADRAVQDEPDSGRGKRCDIILALYDNNTTALDTEVT